MFTFKKNISVGRYRSFENESHDIKIKKKTCGRISEIDGNYGATPDELVGKFKISLAIKKEPTENDPASFKWIFLKKPFETAQEAKDFLNRDLKFIVAKYNLHFFEN